MASSTLLESTRTTRSTTTTKTGTYNSYIVTYFITFHKTHIRSDKYAITRNYLYETIPTLFKQWSLSVEIMLMGVINKRSNILRIGLGGNADKYGDLTPAIFLPPNSKVLRIDSAVNGNKRHSKNLPPMQINQWTKIEVFQLRQTDDKYQFTIRMADTIIYQIINTDPRKFSDVKVYTSDDYSQAANAMIANLTIATFPDYDDSDDSGKLLH